MTPFTTGLPVWLNITCGECSTHQDIQFSPEMTIDLETLEFPEFSCSECGSSKIGKINISGSSNADMKTLEEVRAK